MARLRHLLASTLAAMVLAMPGARASFERSVGIDPGATCNLAILAAEQAHAVPHGLLGAIGRVESGRRDPVSGALAPWPWTIDVEGEGHQYGSEAEAIAAVRGYQAAGRRSIDVGCMQVNLVQHPDAFASLEAAFDPTTNARYAADLLTRLRAGTSSWIDAAGLYHSATPALAAPYRARVTAALDGGPEETILPAAASPSLFAMALPPSGRPGAVLRGMTQPPMQRSVFGRTLAGYRAAPVARAMTLSRG